MATLIFSTTDEGVAFSLSDEAATVPLAQWSLRDLKRADGRSAGIAPLLAGAESGDCTEPSPGTVVASHAFVAGLSNAEAAALGLPDPAPIIVRIKGSGIVTDEVFKLSYDLLKDGRRPVLNSKRVGALLQIGTKSYRLPQPHFGLVEAVERHQEAESGDIDRRLLAWAEVESFIPPDAVVSGSLRETRVVRMAQFGLRPFANAEGEPDFDLTAVGLSARDDSLIEDPSEGEARPLLPPARERDLAKNFRTISRFHGRYVAGAGYYVVLSEEVRQALEIVKEKQASSPEERAAFLRSPRAVIQAVLGDLPNADEISDLFVETEEFSERVREIGVWVPTVVPALEQSPREWVPGGESEEEAGSAWHLFSRLPPEKLAEARKQAAEALSSGEPSVTISGRELPATSGLLDLIDKVIERKTGEEGAEKEPEDRIALLIRGNLEELEYSRANRISEGAETARPTLLEATLLDHQEEGFAWLKKRWVTGQPGAYLADDMGLGKTVQALAFLAWTREHTSTDKTASGPILIVGPTGLLRNWKAEHDKHLSAPGLGNIIELHGSGLRSLRLESAAGGNELGHGLPVLDVDRIRNADCVLTTYETIRDYQHSLGRISWSVGVFDEAQKVKNPATLMTDAAKAMGVDFVVAMTGTPVENRLADLWCVSDLVSPGFFGSLKEFSELYEGDPSENGGRLRVLHERILGNTEKTPLMVRRLKTERLQGLPDISFSRVEREMPKAQADAYAAVIDRARGAAGEPGAMLKALQEMKRVSLHPVKAGEEIREDLAGDSARLAVLFEVLDKVQLQKEKCLVFIESLDVQGHLAVALQRRYQLLSAPMIINGSVSGPARQKRVDKFQSESGFDVMLLSPKAGGVGLTLTAANHVVHLSRWWNPAVEDQSTDRVYRIGQSRNVTVHLPMAVHPEFGKQSFDLILDDLLERKRELNRGVLSPTIATQEDAQQLHDRAVAIP